MDEIRVDIAMIKLFGRLETDFFMASEEVNLLEEGCRKRLDVLNLYPVLIHVSSLGWVSFYAISPKFSPI